MRERVGVGGLSLLQCQDRQRAAASRGPALLAEFGPRVPGLLMPASRVSQVSFP
jgi:hypothetical protein